MKCILQNFLFSLGCAGKDTERVAEEGLSEWNGESAGVRTLAG